MEEQRRMEWKFWFRAGVSVFLVYLCVTYWHTAVSFAGLMLGAAMPLLIGGVIAFLVNIVMRFYETHYFPASKNPSVQKSRRPVCMMAAFCSLAAVVYLIILLVVPQLWSCLEVIAAEVPYAVQGIVEFIEENELLPENMTDTLHHIDWPSRIGQIVQMLTSGLGSVAEVLVTAVTSVFSWIVSGLLSVIFAIYLLSGKEKLGGQFHRLMYHYLNRRWAERLEYVLGVVYDCFYHYIVGQCTEAVIIGVLCALGMMVLKLPYAAMVGALVAFTALIPVAGAYIGAAVGAFMILTVSPAQTVLFLIFIVVLQQVEGNVIYPRVVGSSLGLPGIWVLTAVTVGGGVLGIPGMLLGVPLAATLYRLIQADMNGYPMKK